MTPVAHQGAGRRETCRAGQFGGGRLPRLTVVSQVGRPMSSSPSDLGAWLQAIAQHRDRAAFAALFGAFAPRIKGFLIKTGSPEAAAEELTQEAMLTVRRKADLFDPALGTASAWIYAIARNLRIDRLRHDRNGNFDLIYQVLDVDVPRPDETMESAAREEQVRVALSGLPD